MRFSESSCLFRLNSPAKQAEAKQRDGGDLLAELEKSVRGQIDAMRNEYEAIAKQEAKPA
jgi:hypothetical protein